MIEKPKGMGGMAHAPEGGEGNGGAGEFDTPAQHWQMMITMRLGESLAEVIEQAAEGGTYVYDKLPMTGKLFELGMVLGDRYEEMNAYGDDEYTDALASAEDRSNANNPTKETLESLNEKREKASVVFLALSKVAFELFKLRGGFNEAIDAAQNDDDVAAMLEEIEEARDEGKDYVPMPPPRKEEITAEMIQDAKTRLQAELDTLEHAHTDFMQTVPLISDALATLREQIHSLGDASAIN